MLLLDLTELGILSAGLADAVACRASSTYATIASMRASARQKAIDQDVLEESRR